MISFPVNFFFNAQSEINFQEKVAAFLLIVPLIVKPETSGARARLWFYLGKSNSSEIVFVLNLLFLSCWQCSKLGYSGGKELMSMIFCDYCYRQGVLRVVNKALGDCLFSS